VPSKNDRVDLGIHGLSLFLIIFPLVLVNNPFLIISEETLSDSTHTDEESHLEEEVNERCSLSYGLSLHASWNEINNLTVPILSSAEVDWIRTDWDMSYDMASFATLMRENEIRVLGILDHWTMGFRDDFTLEEWAEVVDDVVSQHADVDAWEVWNEPNIPLFHFGYMDGTPKHYVEMLRTAYDLIKAKSDVVVVFAGLSPYGNWSDWLSKCYELGAANFCDVQGVHVYENPEINGEVLLRTYQISNKDLWITEVGKHSLHPSTELQQAEYLEENFNAIAQLSKHYHHIKKVFWYCFLDYRYATGNAEYCFGLVRSDYSPKPSYFSFVRFCQSSDF